MGWRFFPVNYSSCLFVVVNEFGFEMSVFPLFRSLSPPLFIPWVAVESVREGRYFFRRYVCFRLIGHRSYIQFYGSMAQKLLHMRNAAGKGA